LQYKEFCELRGSFEQCAAALTDAWQKTGKPVRANFPRGYIRTYSSLRSRWPYLDDAQKTLLCQVIQLCDVNRWNLHVWDLSGTAGAACVWHSTIPIIAVIEVICREFSKLKKYVLRDRKGNFENFIWALFDNHVIDHALCDELHRLRKYRNLIHLNPNRAPQIEGNGLPEEWNKACSALARLEEVTSKNS
jgi:hypothetical protein